MPFRRTAGGAMFLEVVVVERDAGLEAFLPIKYFE